MRLVEEELKGMKARLPGRDPWPDLWDHQDAR